MNMFTCSQSVCRCNPPSMCRAALEQRSDSSWVPMSTACCKSWRQEGRQVDADEETDGKEAMFKPALELEEF